MFTVTRMSQNKKLLDLAKSLHADCGDLVQTRFKSRGSDYERVDYPTWEGVLAKANLMLRMLGDHGALWSRSFPPDQESLAHNAEIMEKVSGVILEAVENGWLATIDELVEAEVLSDLTEHAEALIERGYMLAAAVVLRAVLEERLRKMIAAHNLTITGKPGIENFKVALQQAKIVDKLVAKQIDFMAGVGNSAAHNLPEFREADVPVLYQMTIGFLSRFSP